MAAIDDDLHAVETGVAQAMLDELDITTAGVVDAVGLADLVTGHAVGLHVVEDFLFHERFQVVREFEAVRAEDLQAIVFVRIMRSGQHDAGAAAHGLGQMRDRRRRHRSDQEDVHPTRDQSAGQGGLEHIAGDASVLADDDAIVVGPAGAQDPRDRLAYAQGNFRRNRIFVSSSANAVRSEEFGRHGPYFAKSRGFGKIK